MGVRYSGRDTITIQAKAPIKVNIFGWMSRGDLVSWHGNVDIRGLYTRGTCIRNRTGGWQPTERLWIYLRTGQAARHVTQFHYPCWLACAAMPTIFLSLSSSNLPSEFRHEYTHSGIVSCRTLSYYNCVYTFPFENRKLYSFSTFVCRM